MSETILTPPLQTSAERPGILDRLKRIDRVLVVTLGVLAVLAAFSRDQAGTSVLFVANAYAFIAPFFLLSVLAAAWTKGTGLDRQIARAFDSRPMTAVFLAALFGAFSPFCSCGVVPIIAGLLGAGVPLAPVMAFWIASPLMDPQIFLLMAAVFGLPFTVFKAAAAVAMGLGAGYGTHALVNRGAFADPLKGAVTTCCAARRKVLEGAPVEWGFWRDPERLALFRGESWVTGWFLFKWLTLAFLIESLMVAYIPADQVGRFLGGGEWWTIPAAVAVGVPAYLNGFAAIPTVDGLMDLGMAPGPAMAFMIAGGVTSIPAAMAVWALVKRETFAWYIVLGLTGSLLAGLGAQAVLG
ncbi:MAG: permease [Rhodospirillales bacterium CG15_BIG_FIL_POST_REV_8_21_14_020_66_15]|nr:MAG: permease [Rhodospirillales bacterium CG15_BIG_FIL_POST_REV_8_21_14_020_66_15]